MAIATVNPTTGEELERFEPMDAREVDDRIRRAHDAFTTWSRAAVADRAHVVGRAGELLEQRKDEYARLMTLEMGKLLVAAREEAAKCALGCRYYAEHGPAMVADVPTTTGAETGYVAFHPLGVVLAVMPWNFPFWQVIRFAAPALVAGNVGLLKHASNVPQCALALEQLFRDAGAPEGVFQTLLVGSDAVAGVIGDPRVVAATLTGSEGAGSAVASQAGRLIKKTVLELGGSDPFIVMPSAKLDTAVETAVRARTINNGQSCIAAKRFIVHDAVADEFERRFVASMRSLVTGDPTGPAHAGRTARGQAARRGPRTPGKRFGEPRSSGSRGRQAAVPARILLRAHRAHRHPAGLAGLRDELFGPVASLFRARDAADAIRIANDTRFGLGASVWTTDGREAAHFAREIRTGTVFVNGMVASDPRFPFGGVKASGYGRELSDIGLREFVNIKTVRMFGLHGGNEQGGRSQSE